MDPWDYASLLILRLLGPKEKRAFRELNREYEKITREIMADLSEMYAKLDKGEGLTYADAQRFNDLQRFQSRVNAQVTLLGQNNRRIINKLLEETYDLSYSFMSYTVEKELQVLLAGATPHLPSIINQVWQNPIYGLHLEPSMEADRQIIVRDINTEIERGLKDGETYGGIARNIRGVFESSKRRSMTIARTETHRVRERAALDSSINAHRQGVKMEKIWRNMDDERVRETNKANHVNMEGVTVSVDQPFVMVDNPVNSGMCPGSIEGPNNASQNINCRCYSSRRIAYLEAQVPKQMVKDTFADWEELKKGLSS